MFVGSYSRQLSSIGWISSNFCFTTNLFANLIFDSVRANIRSNADGYDIGNNFFIRCLYPNGDGDPGDVERYFLRSRLLLQVCHAMRMCIDGDSFS